MNEFKGVGLKKNIQQNDIWNLNEEGENRLSKRGIYL